MAALACKPNAARETAETPAQIFNRGLNSRILRSSLTRVGGSVVVVFSATRASRHISSLGVQGQTPRDPRSPVTLTIQRPFCRGYDTKAQQVSKLAAPHRQFLEAGTVCRVLSQSAAFDVGMIANSAGLQTTWPCGMEIERPIC